MFVWLAWMIQCKTWRAVETLHPVILNKKIFHVDQFLNLIYETRDSVGILFKSKHKISFVSIILFPGLISINNVIFG